MRVLLTGAAGFIGSAIDPVLRAAGHEVVRVDALLPQAHSVRPEIEDLHELDVRDAGQVVTLIGVAPVKPAEFVLFKLSQSSDATELIGG
jgi:dTDP-L-rhamnose 4-epimerase